MRYDECFLYDTMAGEKCQGARVYHYQGKLTGNQYTYCEVHRPRNPTFIERISHRTD